MDQLEGTTLDLIYRRRVRSFYPGYTIILMAVGMIVALPLVKVDVVSTSGGIIRPHEEPTVLMAPVSGMVDSSLLVEYLHVSTGDTLVWMGRDLPETRIDELRDLIRQNEGFIRDITSILSGKPPRVTSRYIQSFRNHQAASYHLQVQKDFLHGEFKAAQQLYRQEVIPVSEYEQARSDYLITGAKLEDHHESYKSNLEEQLYRLQMDNRIHQGEIARINAAMPNFYVVAPASGILLQCPGITGGSVLQQGTGLGTITPEGGLVAECYLETRDISGIKAGMPVRIRFDSKSLQTLCRLQTEVSQIDPNALVMNGKLVYRIRCNLEDPYFISASGKREPLMLGMTFSASLLLYRATLASLILERLNQWVNPSLESTD